MYILVDGRASDTLRTGIPHIRLVISDFMLHVVIQADLGIVSAIRCGLCQAWSSERVKIRADLRKG